MEEEIRQLKSTLRSLVVSSPSEVDVRSLLRDYREMMGGHVPLRKFGYKDPLTFLKEMCSDCFLFTGAPSNPTLTLIVPDTLKHIDKFVQKQKPSTTTKHKAKRRSVPHSIIEPPKTNLIFESFVNKKKVEELDNLTKPKEKPLDIDPPAATLTNGLHWEHHQVEKKVEGKERKVEDSIETNTVTMGSSTALQNFLKKRIPLFDSLDSDKFNKENEFSKDDIDSGRQTLSSNNSSLKCSKFEHLKTEIRKVIAEHPEGVLCTDLIRLYRERYKKELEFSRWGYTCIVSVVCALGEEVVLTRLEDSGDWLVRDARAASPPPAAPRLHRLHRHYQRVAAAHAPAHDTPAPDVDDALPGVEYDPDVFPEDCMKFTDSLPPPPLSDIRPGVMLEVMVGEVYSPSHFWLMRLGEEYHIALDEMMDEMTEYYSRGEGRTRELARGAARAGQYCACRYERDWHRALVVRELDADCVKVRLVDYGTVEQVSWRSLRALPRRWAALPQQAMRARLAHLAPHAAHWPRAASHHLLRRVHQRHLVAHVVQLHAHHNVLDVFLIDTSGDDDVCLSTEMIRLGHAEPTCDSSLPTSEWHLYPRFDALETGATPNFGEIEQYLRDGIALQFVEDYRRHVPVDLPPSPSSPSSPSCSSSSSSSPTGSTPAGDPSRVPSPPLTRIPLLRVEAGSQTSLSPSSKSSPSPPPSPAPDVRLSVVECEMYRELSAASPMAAHWFMMGAVTRALHASSLSLAPSVTSASSDPPVPSATPTAHEPHNTPVTQELLVPSPPHLGSPMHNSVYSPYGPSHYGAPPYSSHAVFGPPMPHSLHGQHIINPHLQFKSFNFVSCPPQLGPPLPFLPPPVPRGPHFSHKRGPRPPLSACPGSLRLPPDFGGS